MANPVLNWHEHLLGIDVYRDLNDINLRHYSPKLNWHPLQISSVGSSLTVLSAEITLDLLPVERQLLNSSYPDLLFVPLSITSSNIDISPRVEVIDPHVISLRVIQSLPYPKVIVNATVKHSDPHYQIIMDKIQTEWDDKKFLEGEINFNFLMLNLEGAYEVNLNNRYVYDALVENMEVERISIGSAISGARMAIMNNFEYWVKIVEYGNGALDEHVKAYIEKVIYDTWFYTTDSGFKFDNGQEIKYLSLRSPREVPVVDKFVLKKSLLLTHTIKLLPQIES